MNSDIDVTTPLSAEVKILILLMGDFIHFMKQGDVQSGMGLLPHIGAIIDHTGLPPLLKHMIANGRTRNLN